jgi:hypothetical protein
MNLWRPVDDRRDFGAHGAFDSKSRQINLQWLALRERGKIATAFDLGAAIGLASFLNGSRQAK